MQPTPSLAVGALCSAAIVGKLWFLYHREGIKQFYPLMVAAHRQSPLILACATTDALFLGELLFYALFWLLFGGLTPAEWEYLAEVGRPVFAELAATFVLFQPMIGLTTGLHILLMYVTMLVSLLLARRAEEVVATDRDAALAEVEEEEEDLLAAAANTDQQGRGQGSQPQSQAEPFGSRPRAAPSSAHLRITFLIGALYLVNALAIRRQCRQLLRRTASASGDSYYVSLLSAATLHRYVVSSALLLKTAANYLLALVEARYYLRPRGGTSPHSAADDWENRPLWAAAVEVVATGLVALSNCALVALTWADGLRAISIARLAMRAVGKFQLAAQGLLGAVRACARLARFQPLTAADLAREPLCAICRMQLSIGAETGGNNGCRKVPQCGHPFHYRCLKRWLQTGSQECPTCRTVF